MSLCSYFGGNATPIGASANVVATSVSAKSGHPISWGKYCKYCVPATVLVIAVSLGCLFLRYLLFYIRKAVTHRETDHRDRRP